MQPATPHTFNILRDAAHRWGTRPAIIDNSGAISYGELLESASRIATLLSARGVLPREIIAVSCPDAKSFLTSIFAILKLDCIAVPIAPELSLSEQERVISDTGVSWRVFPNDIYRVLDPLANPLTSLYPEAALIRHTSGTTGYSKGVVFSHSEIDQRTDVSGALLRINEDDLILSTLSLSYHFIASALTFIKQGAALIDGTNLSPDEALTLGENYGATVLYASPEQSEALAKQGKILPKLRQAIATSAKLSSSTASAFRERFHVRLTQVFGVIEVGIPIWNDQTENDPSALGYCKAPYRHQVVNENNESLSPGQLGELKLTGPGLFSGYISTKAAGLGPRQTPWFHTGDLVVEDANGLIRLLGRKSSAFRLNGSTYFPEEIERILNTSHNIQLSRAILTKAYSADERNNLAMVDLAVEIVLKPGSVATEEDWREVCTEALRPLTVTAKFSVVSKIPLTGSGKVMRH